MHPDLGGDNDSAAVINEAYAVLMEPDQRAAYDKSRLQQAANDSFTEASAREGEESDQRFDRERGRINDAHCVFCQAGFQSAAGADAFCGRCSSPRLLPKQLHDDSEDRRAILRVPKNTAVKFCTHWPQSRAYQAQSQDISLTGMRFSSPLGLEIGQVVKIDAEMLRAVGQVTRLKQVGANWEIGVKFLSLHFERTRGSFIADCV